MNQFNKKQKIGLIVITIILATAIIYYVYGKENPEIIPYDEEKQMLEESSENKSKEETKFSDTEVVIHISGEVNKEGVYKLKQNSRIADAIEKAEGLTKQGDISELNLAYQLEDGMRIHIPSKLEVEEAKKREKESVEEIQTESYIMQNSGTKIEETEIKNQKTRKKVNINTATQTELETLTGIGPSTALKIIQYRKEKGKFNTIEEIKEVKGIGDSKYAGIQEEICTK